MKKLLMIVAVFAFALTANFAFARYDRHHDNGGEVTIESNNDANIDTNIDVKADTGDNKAEGQRARITTGAADAESDVKVTANRNVTRVGCSTCLRGAEELSIESNNDARIDTNVDVTAETGDNEAEAESEGGRHHRSRGGSASVTTGGSIAYGDAMIMVNSNVTEFGL